MRNKNKYYYFWFDLVFIKKNNQIKIFKKKLKPNRNRFKPTGFGSVWFLEQKLIQISLDQFFWFGSVFSSLARFFFNFFRFKFGSV
jgi:hypothetical protein